MTAVRVIEGRWEDVVREHPELAGQRVKVTVEETAGRRESTDQAIAQMRRISANTRLNGESIRSLIDEGRP
jgi:2-oxo-4-hydroxy-4-carboxy--5-ureidoimidazoline (OHCU) decarboxylase